MRNVLFPLFMFFFSAIVLADNPIIQNYYSADPAPMVYKDRVYLYTSHDEDVTESGFFTMRNWFCYSSADMVNWTDHGIVASLKDFKWLGTLNNGAWAPQCVHREGKFYMYVPIQGKGIGVLVSNSPTGPFTDPIGKALVSKNGYDDIDPTAYVDSDGQAYLYWGNPKLWYVKLNADMTSYTGDVVTVSFSDASFGKRSPADAKRPCIYEEGPWFYKRNSLYYMVFAGGPLPETIGYSTSTGPTGPWTYKGIIMTSQSGFAFTNHAGICDFKENSYLFYHNQGLPGGGGYKRSVCVEQFTYKTDGSIPAITATKNGPVQVVDLNPYDTVQAETMCLGQGVETGICSEGGMNVSNIENGDYIKIKGVDFDSGAISFEVRVASNTSGGKIELYLESTTGTKVGTCDVSGTGGWQNWTTKTCNVSGAKGKHDLYLKFTGGSGTLFNINWWRFKQPQTGVESGMIKRLLNENSIGVSTIKKNVSLNFGPLPADRQNVKVELYNLSGRQIASLFQGKIEKSDLTMSLQGIRSGSYLLKVITGYTVITKTINLQ